MIIVLCISLVWGLSLFSSPIDSTTTEFKSIGVIHYKNKDYLAAKEAFIKCYERDSLDKKGADCIQNYILTQRKLGEKENLYLLNKAIFIYDSLPDSKNKFNLLYTKGRILKEKHNYSHALQFLLLANDGFKKLDETKNFAQSSSTIAHTHRLLGNLPTAIKYYKQALDSYIIDNNDEGLRITYNSLGNTYKDKQDYKAALSYYNKSLEFNPDSAVTNHNIGSTYYLLDEQNKAERFFLKALLEKEKQTDSISILYTINELIQVALDKAELEKSRQLMGKAEKLFSPKDENDAVLRFYETKARYFKQIGYYSKALQYTELYIQQRKTLFAEKQLELTIQLQEAYESKKKEALIQEHVDISKEQVYFIEKQKKEIFLKTALLFVSGLLLCVFGIFVYFLNKSIKRKQEIARLEAVQEGQEVIRKDISRNLHDIISTNYEGIRLKILSLLKSTHLEKDISRIVLDIGEVNEDIRLISHRLSPLEGKLDETIFTEILIQRFSEIEYYSAIKVKLIFSIPESLNGLELKQKNSLYAFVSEALNNVQKHSKATEVKISFQEIKNKISLSISDNGVGIAQNKSSGIGITNLKSHATILRGNFNIHSSVVGTSIYLNFPIS